MYPVNKIFKAICILAVFKLYGIGFMDVQLTILKICVQNADPEGGKSHEEYLEAQSVHE